MMDRIDPDFQLFRHRLANRFNIDLELVHGRGPNKRSAQKGARIDKGEG